jgi:hypothetical protein
VRKCTEHTNRKTSDYLTLDNVRKVDLSQQLSQDCLRDNGARVWHLTLFAPTRPMADIKMSITKGIMTEEAAGVSASLQRLDSFMEAEG